MAWKKKYLVYADVVIIEEKKTQMNLDELNRAEAV
jgi:hypothetical protein